MTRTRWWWVGTVGVLMLAGVLGGCDGGGGDGGIDTRDVCLLFGEREPNATAQTAQVLGEMFVDDCFAVEGDLFDVTDVDSYSVFVQESLTLVVTLEHSPQVDFDIQLFDADTGRLLLDCGVSAVPEVCVLPVAIRSLDLAVDVVVTSVFGAGTYTLTLDAR